MKIEGARRLGECIAERVSIGRLTDADDLLKPVLAERMPFRLLDVMGARIGDLPMDQLDAFLERVAAQRTMGGWVIIGSALRQQLACDVQNTLEKCREYIILANIWHGVDAMGERVTGQALVNSFELTLKVLAPWREDASPWVRHAVGVAVHFWAKHAHGKRVYLPHVLTLLAFVEPLFSEQDITAVKGVGWGLKTLGKYYPQEVSEWLMHQTKREHRALMLRKAMTYLPDENRLRIIGKTA